MIPDTTVDGVVSGDHEITLTLVLCVSLLLVSSSSQSLVNYIQLNSLSISLGRFAPEIDRDAKLTSRSERSVTRQIASSR